MALDREQIESRLSEGNGETPDLSGLDLSGADLSRLDLRGVNLSRADLSAADLRWAVLEGADMHSSVLRRADARWAVMRDANLRQADLGRANLGWADVAGADLTGADLEGASLDSVDLASAVTGGAAKRRPVRPQPQMASAGAGTMVLPRPMALPGAGAREWAAGLSLPQVSPASVAIGLLTLMGLVQLWGWLYRRSYYLGGWELDNVPGLVSAGQGANFTAGLLKVLPLTLKALISTPLFLLAIALLLALVALPVLLLWLFGERVLADIVRPQARPIVVGGLFVAYTVIFLLFIIPGAMDIARWAAANGLPGDRSLRTVGELFSVGGVFTKAGILLALIGIAVPIWVGWRWLSHRVATYEVPLEWRLRYPALNSAAAYASSSPLFAKNTVLTDEERRWGLMGLAGVLLLMATLLAGAGRVQAYADMCDGGDLPRMQLYHGEAPPNVINATLCQRLVVETADAYYVFFPGQTKEGIPGQIDSREPNLRAVEKSDELEARLATGDTADCPSCADGPSGNEVFIVHPNEQRAEGPVFEQAGNLITLDLAPGPGIVDSIRLDETTIITRDGEPVASLEGLLPGTPVVAFGAPDPAQPNLIAAREINILSPDAASDEVPPPGDLQVNLGNPWSPVFEGQGWEPGSSLQVRLVQDDGTTIDKDTPGNVLITVVAGPDGSFSAPYPMSPQVPTGSNFKIAIVDPVTGQTQVGDWLSQPLPTQTPVPTVPSPAPTREYTPTPEPEPGEEGEETATATGEPTEDLEAEATNTALPTPNNLPPSIAPPSFDCDQDEYEPDNSRGRQTVLFPTLSGDLETQEHNFCPKGDIDLYMFQVKAGRHYRVRTLNLAPGVDTVMAVGDLSPGTGCQPWHPSFGCWSDDRNATSLDSEIIFQAVANDLVIVTVDNRGLRSDSGSTYEIGVEQYEPDAEATGTGTTTVTPTATGTSLPLRDIYDNYASNNTCRTASEEALETCGSLKATLGSSGDEDYYTTAQLQPGTYRFVLQPPDGMDYDMDVGLYTGTVSRPICNRSEYRDQKDGDRKEEWGITVTETSTFYVRVYPRPGSKDFDPFNFYYLSLECEGLAPTLTPSITPTPSETPRPTQAPTWTTAPVPSATPTAPGRALPTTGP